MAGTTAICFLERSHLKVICSSKNQDSDAFIKDFVGRQNEHLQIFIDAPLSLPLVYSNPGSADNFFYRRADIEMKAMSPMFLGGLTARAMKLRSELESENIKFYEAYPAAAKNFLPDTKGYKKDLSRISNLAEMMEDVIGYPLQAIPRNWHELDAVLTYYVGSKFASGKVSVAGDAREGLIYY